MDRLPVGNGKRGPITESLQAAFFGLFSGKTAGQVGLAGPGRYECAAHCGRSYLIRDIMTSPEDDVREGLGATPGCSSDPRYARCTVHRPSPHSRGDLAAGLHGAARARASRSGGRISPLPRWITRRPRAPSRCSAARRSRSSRRRSRFRRSRRTAAEFGVELLGLQSSQRGIVHVIGPELGRDAAGQDHRLR